MHCRSGATSSRIRSAPHWLTKDPVERHHWLTFADS
jgi:hypothetical protein